MLYWLEARLAPRREAIGEQIRRGSFEYLSWFPKGRKAHLYLRERLRVSSRPNQKSEPVTVRDYFERWFELQEGRVAHTTLLGYKSHFRKARGILEFVGNRLIADIKRDDLEYLRTAMLEGGAGPKHVKNAIGGSFRALIRDALDGEFLAHNPFENFRWKRITFEGADPYSLEDLEAVFDALRRREFRKGRGSGSYAKGVHFHYYAAAYTIAWTGMRPEEIVALPSP